MRKLNKNEKAALVVTGVIIYTLFISVISTGYWVITFILGLLEGDFYRAFLSVLILVVAASPAVILLNFTKTKLAQDYMYGEENKDNESEVERHDGGDSDE